MTRRALPPARQQPAAKRKDGRRVALPAPRNTPAPRPTGEVLPRHRGGPKAG